MKQFFLFFSFVIALTLFSCNDKGGEVLDDKDELSVTNDSVFTYDMFFDSAIIPYDGTTRATTANDWEDGDVVYLFFPNNTAYGKAEYVSSSKKWLFTCDKVLYEMTNDECYAWCGKGVNPREETSRVDWKNVTSVMYDYMTEHFSSWDGDGTYTFRNNCIYVNVLLRPVGWRLRFKGPVGTKILVSSHFINHDVGICKNATFGWGSSDQFSLTVGSNGYTDYFVGDTEEMCTSIVIENENTGESFSHYFDINTLLEGESGCFTIPTTSDLHGWTKTSGSNTINGHEYVDLGLPSGTKWATCNIGASSPDEGGVFFQWGETEESEYWDEFFYSYYDNSTATYINIGEDIAGTEYDVARMKWGDSWKMPSLTQIRELVDNCSSNWTTLNNQRGMLVTGPNGASIFLPAVGDVWCDGAGSYNEDYPDGVGYYWSSSLNTNDINGFSSHVLFFYPNYFGWSQDARSNGCTVRAVCQ